MTERQPGLFDAAEGERRKQEGMASAANNLSRTELLRLARKGARLWAEYMRKTSGHAVATADDAYRYLESLGHNPDGLGPAAGSIFKGGDWVFTGDWINSKRIKNHARSIRVWRLERGGYGTLSQTRDNTPKKRP